MKELVEIYTDGACRGNPGPGGWGCHYSYKGHVKELCGGEPDTTNNRMELMAAIMAIEGLKRPCEAIVYSDSQYLIKGISIWIHNWKMKNFKGVKNVELWKRLDAAVQPHQITWQWIPGHSDNKGNDLADKLAHRGLYECIA